MLQQAQPRNQLGREVFMLRRLPHLNSDRCLSFKRAPTKAWCTPRKLEASTTKLVLPRCQAAPSVMCIFCHSTHFLRLSQSVLLHVFPNTQVVAADCVHANQSPTCRSLRKLVPLLYVSLPLDTHNSCEVSVVSIPLFSCSPLTIWTATGSRKSAQKRLQKWPGQMGSTAFAVCVCVCVGNSLDVVVPLAQWCDRCCNDCVPENIQVKFFLIKELLVHQNYD